jgi:hypothetical protein
MPTICYYLSDYGFGHAARAIGVIRALIEVQHDLRIIVKTSGPVDLVRRSLDHSRISVIDSRNECDVIHIEGASDVDRAATRTAFLSWIGIWDEYVSREVAFCRDHNVDLILSDITPQAFVVAETLGIPGVAISNFTWEKIYQNLFRDREEVGRLRDAYDMASYACILPFEIGMERLSRSERVGLVSRRITVSRMDMRRRLGFSDDDFLIFLGRSPTLSDTYLPGIDRHGLCHDLASTTGSYEKIMDHLSGSFRRGDTTVSIRREQTIRYIVPSGVTFPGATSIPSSETESQNWIGMCDCVVTKCGYSTISEAVQARIPLYVWKREGFIEDEAIASKIEHLGIGTSVKDAREGISQCLSGFEFLQDYREKYDTLDIQYLTDGIPVLLRVVQERLT